MHISSCASALRTVLGSAFCTAFALCLVTPTAHANTFSSVVVYGDSLSDNGNLYGLDGGLYPASPYYQGRLSNGPLAVEQLAASLQAPLVDFAYAGATSGIGNIADGGTTTAFGFARLPGLRSELAGSASSLTHSALSTGLFVVWGGSNDYAIGGSASMAAADIIGIVTTLQSEGAQHILVPGTPDLGLTPEYYGVASATTFSEAFNTALQAGLPAGTTYADTFNLLHSVVANPSAYGLQNVTDPCYNQATGTVCSNPSQYLFFDGLHPTTAADTLLSTAFQNDLTVATTPEPTSLALLGTGVLAMAGMLRRRSAKA